MEFCYVIKGTIIMTRFEFYGNLNKYHDGNSLSHKQSPLYGKQNPNAKYYRREGQPGNYRYFKTKEEYDTYMDNLINKNKSADIAKKNEERRRQDPNWANQQDETFEKNKQADKFKDAYKAGDYFTAYKKYGYDEHKHGTTYHTPDDLKRDFTQEDANKYAKANGELLDELLSYYDGLTQGNPHYNYNEEDALAKVKSELWFPLSMNGLITPDSSTIYLDTLWQAFLDKKDKVYDQKEIVSYREPGKKDDSLSTYINDKVRNGR